MSPTNVSYIYSNRSAGNSIRDGYKDKDKYVKELIKSELGIEPDKLSLKQSTTKSIPENQANLKYDVEGGQIEADVCDIGEQRTVWFKYSVKVKKGESNGGESARVAAPQ